MASSTETFAQRLRSPAAGTAALWSLAILQTAYYLTTHYGHSPFAAYLWLALDLALTYRVSRAGRYAWAALVALNAFNLPTYLFAATGTAHTGQSATWLPVHALLTVAIIGLLLTPAVRRRLHASGGLPLASSGMAVLLLAALALSSLVAVGLSAGTSTHGPTKETHTGANQ